MGQWWMCSSLRNFFLNKQTEHVHQTSEGDGDTGARMLRRSGPYHRHCELCHLCPV